jgi:spore germination protein GerM
MRRVRTRCVVFVAGAILAVGCGVPIDDNTQTIASEDVPFELLDPAPTTTTSTTIVESGPTTTTVSETVYLYLVRNDRVEEVEREVSEPMGVEARVLLLASELLPEEQRETFRSAVPIGSINKVTPSGGVATVDLAAPFTELPPSDQVLAFAQITYTLVQMPGIGQVAFTLETQPISPIDDQGTVLLGPATFEDYSDLLAS